MTRRTETGNLLLMAQSPLPPGRYSVVSRGTMGTGESLEERKQRGGEETAIRIKNIRYFGSQPWPFPSSLMIGFTAEYDCGEIVIEGGIAVCALVRRR